MLYYSSVVKTMAQIKNLRKIKKLLTKAMIHDKLIELLMSNKNNLKVLDSTKGYDKITKLLKTR
ncbi:MAG: hypothetical protein ACLRNZ_16560, partial [Blautia massiliensis (ex Durand et al. 2017)]